MEEEKFHCKKCNKEISGHNQYCHDKMCDDCFFETYFPEPNFDKFKEELKKAKNTVKEEYKEFLGKKETYFEKKFSLSRYIEPSSIGEENIPTLLSFVKIHNPQKLILFKLYN